MNPARLYALCAMMLLTSIPAAANDMSFMHFWSSTAERRAVDELRKNAATARLAFRDVPVSGHFESLRSALLASLIRNDPPDASQWIVGDELGRLIENDILLPVESRRVDFSRVLLPEIYRLIQRPEGISNLPLGIHIQNIVVFNKPAFAKIGQPVPTSWDALVAAAADLHKAGIQPLVMSRQPWQMQSLFQGVLSSILTASEFKKYLDDDLPSEDLRLKFSEAFRIIGALSGFVPKPVPNLPFYEGARMVSTGTAAAYALGDFLVPELLPGAPVVCMIAPRSQSILFGVDGMLFVNKQDAQQKARLRAFVDAFYLENGATKYVRAKGGVSVLLADHAKVSDDTCATQSQRAWNEMPNKFWLYGDAWQNHLRIVGNFTSDFIATPGRSPEAAAVELLHLMKKL